MLHIFRCIRQAFRHPKAAVEGAREFRSGVTRNYEAWDVMESYDAGRELAHIATFRHYDW